MGALSETTFTFQTSATVEHRRQTSILTWMLWFLFVLGACIYLGQAMVASAPNPSFIAWLLFFTGIAVILYQPRYGIYLIVFLSLVGDKVLVPSYPFYLNFSSRESLLYLDQRLITSPLEVYLMLTLLSWFVRCAILRKLHFQKGELFWPMLIFMAFVVFGMVYGLGRGGNLNIGLWEARPIFYLPFMMVLAGNLITERDHVITLMGLVVAALFIEGWLGISYYFSTIKGNPGIDAAAVMEHSAPVHMDSLFVFCLALWLYQGPLKARLLTLLMGLPVIFTFLITQRRAAFLALLFALILMAFLLYKQNQTTFWIVVPALILVFSLYLIAFWNNSGTLGIAARAIKSQVAPEQASLRDQRSDNYRLIENYDIRYTIRQYPMTGVGFGQMFIMAIPLPDISFFVWYRYITHNSIGWIWMKTGAGGFIAMLFLVGLSIMTGLRAVFRIRDGVMRATILTATLYILMHFLYAYVDMSWDSQSMVYLGTMMGLIGSIEMVLGVQGYDNR